MAFADTGEMLAYAGYSFDLVDLFANSLPDYVGQLDTMRGDAVGVFGRGVDELYAADRRDLLILVDQRRMQAKFDVILDQFMEDIGEVAETRAEQRAALHTYMDTNSQSVKERALTFGSRSFSGTGNGSLYRLLVDEDAHEMQGWFADSYTLECEFDQRTLRRSHEERFVLKGTGASLDALEPGGQDVLGRLVALNPTSSLNLVKNGMFATAGLTGVTVDTLGTWNITTGNLESDTSNTYWTDVRGVPAASLRSLKFTDNDTISQDIVVDAGNSVIKDRPYFCSIVVYRESSCDGTTTFTVGNQNVATTMTTLSNSAFNVITLPIDEDLWFKNLNKNAFTVSVQLSGRTTGTMSVAGVVVAPMTRLGSLGDSWTGRGCMGQYFALLAGPTPFVTGDSFTWTDSEGTRGETQYWWARGGYGYLVHAASPTIADK